MELVLPAPRPCGRLQSGQVGTCAFILQQLDRSHSAGWHPCCCLQQPDQVLCWRVEFGDLPAPASFVNRPWAAARQNSGAADSKEGIPKLAMVLLSTSKAVLLHIAAPRMCQSSLQWRQTHFGHASDLQRFPTCCSFMNITMSIATYACICKELKIQMR